MPGFSPTNRSRPPGSIPTRLRAVAPVAALLAFAFVGCAAGPTPFIDDPLVARVYEVVPPDVIVRNDGGVISLSGFIEGLGKEQAIVDAVASIEGVRRVDSNIILRGDDG